MIIFGGGLVGMAIAIVVCLLQQHLGFIRMGQSEGSFIIDAYPVIVEAWDMVAVMLTVITLGAISVMWATRKITRI